MNVTPVGEGDDAAVAAIFTPTLALGRPMVPEPPRLDGYVRLCLEWYLTEGRPDAAVLRDDGRVVGYALACTDQDSYRRWSRRRGCVFAATTALHLATHRSSAAALRFWAARLRDGVDLLRAPVVLPAHAHINLLASHRAGRAGRMLVDHVDDRCRRAGLPGWVGEINAVAGHRARALGRLGATVVHRSPNRTLTWALGTPVERLSVARHLGR